MIDSPDTTVFIRLRGHVQGPYDTDKLRALARRGRFSRSHEVSIDGQTWLRATEFPELFPPPPPRKIRRAAARQLRSGEQTGHADFEIVADGDSSGELNPLAIGAEFEQPWYYTRNWKECGPEEFGELQRLAGERKLRPDDLVWTEGMADWTDAASVPGLFEQTPRNWGAVPVVDKRAESAARSPSTATAVRAAPMAVASLVLGLLGTNILLIVGSILAVVFGHVALKQIRECPETFTGRGMAITGLILGYAVVILAAVAAIVVLFVYLLYGELPQFWPSS